MKTKQNRWALVLILVIACCASNALITFGQQGTDITDVKVDYQDVKKVTYTVVFQGDANLRHVVECRIDTVRTNPLEDTSIELAVGRNEAQFPNREMDATYYFRVGSIQQSGQQPATWSEFAQARALLSLKPIPPLPRELMGPWGWVIFFIIAGIFVLCLAVSIKKRFGQLRKKKVLGDEKVIEEIITHWKKFKDQVHIDETVPARVLDVNTLSMKSYDPNTFEILGDHKGRDHLDNAICVCRDEGGNTPTVRILMAGLKNHWNNYVKNIASQEVDRNFEKNIVNEKARLQGRTSDMMWFFAGISPLLGLFGTVVGLLQAFRKLGPMAGRGPEAILKSITSGIGTAIITTIVGLLVGILVYAMYQIIKSRIDNIFDRWEKIYMDITAEIT